MSNRLAGFAKLGVLIALGAGAGWAARRIGLPIPYMIGPLLLTAGLYLSGVAAFVIPARTRPFGQGVVAGQVGLYFSSGALALVLHSAPLLVGLALITIVSSLAAACAISRFTGTRFSMALVSSIPVGPVEAAAIAERCGMARAPVVFVQTLRMAAVVVLAPILLYAVEGWPDRSGAPPSPGGSSPLGMLLLAAASIAGALLFKAARLANPFFLGPLGAVAALTAAGVEMTAFPYPVLALAQILLGSWLGSTFRRDLFRAAGPLVIGALVTTGMLIALNSLGAVTLAAALGRDWRDFLLGAAPGGVTEMALTAKYLGLDVPLITAFHLTRIFLIVPNAAWVIRALHSRENRRENRRAEDAR